MSAPPPDNRNWISRYLDNLKTLAEDAPDDYTTVAGVPVGINPRRLLDPPGAIGSAIQLGTKTIADPIATPVTSVAGAIMRATSQLPDIAASRLPDGQRRAAFTDKPEIPFAGNDLDPAAYAEYAKANLEQSLPGQVALGMLTPLSLFGGGFKGLGTALGTFGAASAKPALGASSKFGKTAAGLVTMDEEYTKAVDLVSKLTKEGVSRGVQATPGLNKVADWAGTASKMALEHTYGQELAGAFWSGNQAAKQRGRTMIDLFRPGAGIKTKLPKGTGAWKVIREGHEMIGERVIDMEPERQAAALRILAQALDSDNVMQVQSVVERKQLKDGYDAVKDSLSGVDRQAADLQFGAQWADSFERQAQSQYKNQMAVMQAFDTIEAEAIPTRFAPDAATEVRAQAEAAVKGTKAAALEARRYARELRGGWQIDPMTGIPMRIKPVWDEPDFAHNYNALLGEDIPYREARAAGLSAMDAAIAAARQAGGPEATDALTRLGLNRFGLAREGLEGWTGDPVQLLNQLGVRNKTLPIFDRELRRPGDWLRRTAKEVGANRDRVRDRAERAITDHMQKAGKSKAEIDADLPTFMAKASAALKHPALADTPLGQTLGKIAGRYDRYGDLFDDNAINDILAGRMQETFRRDELGLRPNTRGILIPGIGLTAVEQLHKLPGLSTAAPELQKAWKQEAVAKLNDYLIDNGMTMTQAGAEIGRLIKDPQTMFQHPAMLKLLKDDVQTAASIALGSWKEQNLLAPAYHAANLSSQVILGRLAHAFGGDDVSPHLHMNLLRRKLNQMVREGGADNSMPAEVAPTFVKLHGGVDDAPLPSGVADAIGEAANIPGAEEVATASERIPLPIRLALFGGGTAAAGNAIAESRDLDPQQRAMLTGVGGLIGALYGWKVPQIVKANFLLSAALEKPARGSAFLTTFDNTIGTIGREGDTITGTGLMNDFINAVDTHANMQGIQSPGLRVRGPRPIEPPAPAPAPSAPAPSAPAPVTPPSPPVAPAAAAPAAAAAAVPEARPLRVLITGSRGWTDEAAIEAELLKVPPGSTIIHGGAGGADKLAGQVAERLGLNVEVHPADWSTGRGAGFQRNQKMVDLGADAALAFHLGNSPGTADAIRRIKAANIPVRVNRGGGPAPATAATAPPPPPPSVPVTYYPDPLVTNRKTGGQGIDIGRPMGGGLGDWGNPYKVGAINPKTGQKIQQGEAVQLYADYIVGQPDKLARIGELRGQQLKCWCAPLPCHGHVLARLANDLDPSLPPDQLMAEAKRILASPDPRFGEATVQEIDAVLPASPAAQPAAAAPAAYTMAEFQPGATVTLRDGRSVTLPDPNKILADDMANHVRIAEKYDLIPEIERLHSMQKTAVQIVNELKASGVSIPDREFFDPSLESLKDVVRSVRNVLKIPGIGLDEAPEFSVWKGEYWDRMRQQRAAAAAPAAAIDPNAPGSFAAMMGDEGDDLAGEAASEARLMADEDVLPPDYDLLDTVDEATGDAATLPPQPAAAAAADLPDTYADDLRSLFNLAVDDARLAREPAGEAMRARNRLAADAIMQSMADEGKLVPQWMDSPQFAEAVGAAGALDPAAPNFSAVQQEAVDHVLREFTPFDAEPSSPLAHPDMLVDGLLEGVPGLQNAEDFTDDLLDMAESMGLPLEATPAMEQHLRTLDTLAKAADHTPTYTPDPADMGFTPSMLQLIGMDPDDAAQWVNRMGPTEQMRYTQVRSGLDDASERFEAALREAIVTAQQKLGRAPQRPLSGGGNLPPLPPAPGAWTWASPNPDFEIGPLYRAREVAQAKRLARADMPNAPAGIEVEDYFSTGPERARRVKIGGRFDAQGFKNTFADDRGQFSANEIYRLAQSYGATPQQAARLRAAWDDAIYTADEAGKGNADNIHINYQDINNLIYYGKMGPFPFLTWQAKAIPKYLQILAHHPALAIALNEYTKATEEELQEAGLPESFRNFAQGDGLISAIASSIMGRPGEAHFNPLPALFPYSDVGKESSEYASPTDQAFDAMRSLGLGPSPLITLPAYMAGLTNDLPVNMLRTSPMMAGISQFLTGHAVDPEELPKRAARAVRSAIAQVRPKTQSRATRSKTTTSGSGSPVSRPRRDSNRRASISRRSRPAPARSGSVPCAMSSARWAGARCSPARPRCAGTGRSGRAEDQGRHRRAGHYQCRA